MRKIFDKAYQFLNKTVIALWKQMKLLQKIIALSVVVLLFVGIIVVSVLSGTPDRVYLFTNGISDPALLQRITFRLDSEDIVYQVDNTNRISVQNRSLAQYARSILIREDMLPQDTDPWELFDVQRWTQTDFERNINLQRSITKQLELHISALDEIDSTNITLVMPEDSLFESDRNPVTASVILQIKPNSDFRENRRKIEGVQKLILLAVEGLQVENLTINDGQGLLLNDFERYADFDSLELTKRELKIKKDYEEGFEEEIISALSDIYTADRVRIVNINVEFDFSKKSEEITENFPIVVKEDNPETPYNEREVVLSVPRSQENISEKYSGTGFNPEGPPGVEGQVPPSYKDLDGIVGSWDHNTSKVNNEINQRKTIAESRPTVSRVTASVAIDGRWYRKYDEKGNLMLKPNGKIEREYIPLTTTEVRKALLLVRGAVGFSQDRADNISIENVSFDRTAEFEKEDNLFRRRQLTRQITVYAIVGFFVLVIIFLIARVIARQIELARVRKEERLAEQYRRMREAQISAMSEIEEDEEESELQILTNQVRELVHNKPDDVTALIKTWMEE